MAASLHISYRRKKSLETEKKTIFTMLMEILEMRLDLGAVLEDLAVETGSSRADGHLLKQSRPHLRVIGGKAVYPHRRMND
jgi:hypothetical protein